MNDVFYEVVLRFVILLHETVQVSHFPFVRSESSVHISQFPFTRHEAHTYMFPTLDSYKMNPGDMFLINSSYRNWSKHILLLTRVTLLEVCTFPVRDSCGAILNVHLHHPWLLNDALAHDSHLIQCGVNPYFEPWHVSCFIDGNGEAYTFDLLRINGSWGICTHDPCCMKGGFTVVLHNFSLRLYTVGTSPWQSSGPYFTTLEKMDQK